MKRNKNRVLTLAVALLLPLNVLGQEYIELPDFGDSAGAIISPEQERKLGEGFMREVRRQAPLVTDEEIEDYIQELGDSLGDLTNYYGDFTFFIIESPVINAFAVPGGFVGFHTGLILETQTESELASVMAHEVSHLTQRHTARMIEEAGRMNLPTIAALLGSIALAAVNPQAGAAAVMATQAAAMQHQINFTRANEKEADRIGIQLLSEAAYDTDKMAVFFERMQRANRYSDPKYIPEYLRTHPITVNRIAEARSRAESLRPAVVREDSYKYYLVKAKLAVNGAPNPARAKQFFRALLDDGEPRYEEIARYGYALALAAAGDFDLARVELLKLMAEYPTMVAFRLAAAKTEETARAFEAALAHYEAAIAIDPESRAAIYGYINALLLVQRPDEAKKALGEWGLADRRDPRFFQLLAQAETDTGDRAGGHSSLAEYYWSVGEFERAAEQLRIARAVPSLSNYQRQKILARLEDVEDTLMKLEQGRRR